MRSRRSLCFPNSSALTPQEYLPLDAFDVLLHEAFEFIAKSVDGRAVRRVLLLQMILPFSLNRTKALGRDWIGQASHSIKQEIRVS